MTNNGHERRQRWRLRSRNAAGTLPDNGNRPLCKAQEQAMGRIGWWMVSNGANRSLSPINPEWSRCAKPYGSELNRIRPVAERQRAVIPYHEISFGTQKCCRHTSSELRRVVVSLSVVDGAAEDDVAKISTSEPVTAGNDVPGLSGEEAHPAASGCFGCASPRTRSPPRLRNAWKNLLDVEFHGRAGARWHELKKAFVIFQNVNRVPAMLIFPRRQRCS